MSSKIFHLLFLLVLLSSCTKRYDSDNRNVVGYIYSDSLRQPIINTPFILYTEDWVGNRKMENKVTFVTDDKGYFMANYNAPNQTGFILSWPNKKEIKLVHVRNNQQIIDLDTLFTHP